MVNSFNRTKITVLSTLVIIMVVFLHSFYPDAREYSVAGKVQSIVTEFFSMANAFFFTLSGFLFFNETTCIKDCCRKIKKRARTLLVPYILWNLIVVLIFLFLFTLNITVSNDLIPVIINGTLFEALQRIFIEPAGFQLWFLRDLMVFVILTPVLFVLIKHLSFILPLSILLLDPFIHCGNLLFFISGGCIALKISLDSIDSLLRRSPARIVIAFVFLLYCVVTVLKALNIWWDSLFIVVFQLFGVISVWTIYNWVVKKDLLEINWIKSICGYSFFIFCFHEPTLNIFKSLFISLLGKSDAAYISCFFASPIIMVIFAILVAKVMERYIPNVYKVLVGGR